MSEEEHLSWKCSEREKGVRTVAGHMIQTDESTGTFSFCTKSVSEHNRKTKSVSGLLCHVPDTGRARH
jgi:hypothetical protein